MCGVVCLWFVWVFVMCVVYGVSVCCGGGGGGVSMFGVVWCGVSWLQVQPLLSVVTR